MKTLVSCILVLSIWVVGHAQPILDSANFYAETGLQLKIKRSYNYQVIETGTDFTWDFSFIDTSAYQTDTIEFVILDSICDGLFLPGGNYYGSYPNSNTYIKKDYHYSFYSNSNSGYFWEGDGICLTNNTTFGYCTIMKKIMDFPFTYNSAATGSFYGTVPNFPFPYMFFSGYVDIVADGYGTLILPNITFDNVLKLTIMETWQNDPLPPDTTYYDTWYSPEVPHPVLSIRSSLVVRYFDEIITETGKQLAPDKTFDLYPNPATTHVMIALSEQPRQKLNYSLFDLLGNSLSADIISMTENKFVIDVHGLKPGIYFIRIDLDGNVIVKKFIKK